MRPVRPWCLFCKQWLRAGTLCWLLPAGTCWGWGASLCTQCCRHELHGIPIPHPHEEG